MRLVVSDPLLVVDATVQGDVEAEGEQSHALAVVIWSNTGTHSKYGFTCAWYTTQRSERVAGKLK